MSMTATFTDGVLAVAGDALDNKLAVSRTLAGTLYLNGGTIPIGGGPATVSCAL